MKVTVFIVLTAFLGIASSNTVCMQFKMSRCFAVVTTENFDNPICAEINELTNCLRREARECNVEDLPVVREVIASYTETCREGTEMNDLYKKHKTCVFLTAAIGNAECLRPIMAELIVMGPPSQTQEYREKVLKVACKYKDSGNKCIDDNVNSTCGAEAVKFRRQLSDASTRLSHKACEEVETENNGIHYNMQQHHDHSVHAMTPNTQYISATGSQAGSIQIVSTIAPGTFMPMSGATVNVSSQLIYILLATVFMKWFSSY